ncbi:MAG: hypothetical protein IJ224_07040 [Lachnospiraceae bacterium]|nr:hypothetical protein [Lachnospiraceae bacterium]
MTIKQLITELNHFDPSLEVKICCYTSINDPEEMVIYHNLIDKNGNTPCQIHKSITLLSLEKDGKTVAIS